MKWRFLLGESVWNECVCVRLGGEECEMCAQIHKTSAEWKPSGITVVI